MSLCKMSFLLWPPNTTNPALLPGMVTKAIPCPLLPEGLAIPCNNHFASCPALGSLMLTLLHATAMRNVFTFDKVSQHGCRHAMGSHAS